MVVVTVTKSVRDPGRARRFASVESLFDALAELEHQVIPNYADDPKVFEQLKREGEGVIPAHFKKGSKSVAALRAESAAWFLPIDLDHLPGTNTPEGRQRIAALEAAMSQWESVAWTTASSDPERGIALRWLVALDEPLPNHDAPRWRAVYRAAVRALGVEDDYDQNACDSVRLSFLPQVQEGLVDSAATLRFTGRKLCLQELDAAAALQGALHEAQTTANIAVKRTQRDQEAYEKALERTTRQVAKAKSGERNVTLNRVVYRLASKWGHVLDRDQVEAVLVPALRKSDTDPNTPIDYGAALAQIRKSLDDGEAVNRTHRESWQGRLTLTDRGLPASTQANVNTALSHHEALVGVLRWDDRAGRAMVVAAPPWATDDGPWRPRRLDDMDAAACVSWLRDELHIEHATEAYTHAGLIYAAKLDSYDPVRDYMDRLDWDGKPRLDGWLARHAGAEDTELGAALFSKWMISAVARTFNPGCQADYTLILEGAQGLRKSTFLRTLAGAEHFQDTIPDINGKDAKMACHGPLIIEFGELRNLTNKEVEHVKAFLTCRVDRYRPPYGREEVEKARRCVFAGSTNDSVYLRDTTGNRRFWPVRVGRINIKRARRDRDQLWAEAVHRYREGEQWHLNAELEAEAAKEQAARRLGHPWEDELRRKLENGDNLEALHKSGSLEPGQFDPETRTLRWVSGEYALRLIGVDRARMQDSQQVARTLQAIGWERKRGRFVGDNPVWRYVPKSDSVGG